MKIFHNPRCSKSRQTLALLQQHGVEPDVILYLDTPPSAEELVQLGAKLGAPVKELFRFKEALAKELGIKPDDERSNKEWAQLLANNPKLLERPVVVNGSRAVVGRPPENVLAIID